MGMFEGVVFFGLMWLVVAVLWLVALVDILKSEFKDGLTKVIWLILVIFLPFLGSMYNSMVEGWDTDRGSRIKSLV
jgi:hypothetical protein